MRLMLVGLLICLESVLAVDVATCSTANNSEFKLTLEPYDDAVVGRYLAKLCTDPVPGATKWSMRLMVHKTEQRCKQGSVNDIYFPGETHSDYEEAIKVEGNCPQKCLNTTFDLIFSGCYSIRSSFLVGTLIRQIEYTYFNIKNNYTKKDFMQNPPKFDVINQDEENLTILWHTGVPFEDYDFQACRIINMTTQEEDTTSCESWSGGGGEGEGEGGGRGEQCSSPSPTELQCKAALPDGCYMLRLSLYASWRHGLFYKQANVPHLYCKQRSQLESGAGAGAGQWAGLGAAAWAWAGYAALGVGAAAAAVWLVCRSREARAMHKEVLRNWLIQRNDSSPAPSPAPAAALAPAPAARRHVLLLYAREGPHADPLISALKSLLQLADVQVYDIFGAEVLGAAAAAPGGWVRGMVRRGDVTVLLLQTPALACLYAQHLQPAAGHGNNLKLVEPLLGRRVQYRAPQFGDALVQYALQLAGEDALAHSDYNKYYLATLSELPTEILPRLVPYRRYSLPAAAGLLLRDMCEVTPARDVTAGLAAAARAFVDHVTDNPNYLMDELMLL